MAGVHRVDPNSPGGRLREIRTNRGIKQRDLAERSGVPQSTIVEIETGMYSLNRDRQRHRDYVDRICSVLDCYPSDIWGESSFPKDGPSPFPELDLDPES